MNIFNSSDDIFGSDSIVYTGTDKEKALAYFDKQYSYIADMPDDKYYYEYSMYEFTDEYKFVGTVLVGDRKLIKHIDNLKDE